jgi:hypothetical protein
MVSLRGLSRIWKRRVRGAVLADNLVVMVDNPAVADIPVAVAVIPVDSREKSMGGKSCN